MYLSAMVAMERLKKHNVHFKTGNYMSRERKTTIELSVDTRDKLKNIGKKSETYDEIINRLLKLAKQKEAT